MDWDLQRFIFLKQSLSESSGAFPGVAADEGLPGHPVEERQDHDDFAPVSYCVWNGFAIGLKDQNIVNIFKARCICFLAGSSASSWSSSLTSSKTWWRRCRTCRARARRTTPRPEEKKSLAGSSGSQRSVGVNRTDCSELGKYNRVKNKSFVKK